MTPNPHRSDRRWLSAGPSSTGGRRARQNGVGLLEVILSVLLLALILPPLFDLQSGSDRTLVKAGEFMVASAVLQNTSAQYRLKPFRDIESTTFGFDESGSRITSGRPAFQVNIEVEPVVMPNHWSKYKRISIDVLKPGTFFGTTLLKTALIRVATHPDD